MSQKPTKEDIEKFKQMFETAKELLDLNKKKTIHMEFTCSIEKARKITEILNNED